jgi:hypothetical protein
VSPFFEHIGQLVEVDGFAEVIVHTGGQAVLAVFAGGVGRYRDDNGLCAFVSTDEACGFEAVHFGHLDIHEYEVVAILLELFEDFFSIGGHAWIITHFIEDDEGQLLVDGVVLGQEDAERIFPGQVWDSGG